MSTATYTLHVVRGEQPNAAGTELGQSDLESVDLGQDVWGWLAEQGTGADDLTWVLVTADGEHPGELHNLVAQRDIAVETAP